MVRDHSTVAAVRSEPLQLFGPTAQPHRRFLDSRWRGGLDSDSEAGSVRVAERVCSQPIPVRPDSKRTRPGREPEPEPESGTGAGRPPSPLPQSRAKTPSTQRARPLFSIFSI